jgi:4a-hydroxytetrahydrobiopterin dehydratase
VDLVEKSCVPCRGGIAPLEQAAAQQLRSSTPGWELLDGATKLSRNFELADFVASLSLVNKIGELAENEGHHPDITFGWGYCNVLLYTHKIKGLHQNDFIMAAKINELAAD